VIASITANGATFTKSSAYLQTSTASSIANDLYNKFVADTNFNQVVRVNPPGTGTTLAFTTIAAGAGTNYPISTSAATTSANFAAGSTSFTISPAGNSSFTPGQNGILWDTGTVTATLTGFTTATVAPKQASYGQGSNAASVAGLLAAQMHNDPMFPVDAVVTPAGSATIVLTARDQGTDGNSYNIAIAGQTSQPSSFTTASFPAVSVTLANGANPVPSFTPGTVLITTYTYNNNQVVVHQGQQTRTYVFDGLGRMTSSTVPETGYLPTTATYTDFGAPATITDPRQLTSTFVYDPLNRVQSVTFSDGTPSLAYNYGSPGDANNTGGRLASVQQKLSNGTIVSSDGYQYDVMGRETQCSKTIAGNLFNIGYLYNADGSLQKITYPSGRTVNITEDDIGRLAQIASNGTTVLSAIGYNAANEVLNATYGGSMQAQYTYNDRLQLSTLTFGNAGTTAMNLAYNYGAGQNNGQILGITDKLTPSQSTAYGYDELGRLKTAQTTDLTSANTWKLKYGYDRYGNRLEQVPQAGTAAMPLSETPVDPTTNRVTTLQYDNAGNVVNDGLHSYAFNGLNQLTKVDGSATPFTYDAAGQRVTKNGAVYIYSGRQVIAEYSSGAAATAPSVEYIYGLGGLLASIVPSGTMTYYYRDHLSSRSLASSTGATTGTVSTFPFGESRLQSGAATKWQFTSYERDNASSDSGLDYANARYYSSRIGRFTSMDPLTGSFGNPQSLNRFAYVTNDPMNMVDPSGTTSGNWTCLLNDHGDCFGGDYAGAGLNSTAGIGLEEDPFGPMVDPTKWNPMKDGEDRYLWYMYDDLYRAAGGTSSYQEGDSGVAAAQTVDSGAFGGSVVPNSVAVWRSPGGSMNPAQFENWANGFARDFYNIDEIFNRRHPNNDVALEKDIFHCASGCLSIWENGAQVGDIGFIGLWYTSAAVAGTSQAVYATGTEIGQDASAWLYRIGWGEILESISEHAQDIVDMFRGPFGRW
jgi:RHS repeat-associated protein